jgi:hypothetical protein
MTRHSSLLSFFKYFLGGGFFYFSYCIQHCFICRLSDSTVPTNAGIEPRTLLLLHWQSDARLDLTIHYYLPLNNIERKESLLMLRYRHPCSLLRELRLSHCYLGRNGFNSQAFHRLPSLEILDLSENFLNTIPPAARLPTVRVCPL